MDEKKSSLDTKQKILDEYYTKIYQEYLFGRGVQSCGIEYFEKAVEKFWLRSTPAEVLELGGGSGEHLKYLEYVPLVRYISLDLRLPITKVHTDSLSSELKQKISFMKGNAEKLPFGDEEFDRVYSTCLLHHVDDVLAVLMEARRVTRVGGEIAFVIPTDPGFMNQIVKKIVSFPKMKKLSKISPKLFYALEHKNHIGGILELIKYVFVEDQLKMHYRPFGINSWNFNLLVVAVVTKR